MDDAVDKVTAALDATIATLEKALNTTEIEGLAAINSAYTMCAAESGPVMQYLGAGYYVKRAPMTIKRALEQKLKLVKEQSEAASTKPAAEDITNKAMQSDTIEIIERYDSSDE